MIVRTRTIRFNSDRRPSSEYIKLGFEGDNLVERLEFVLPMIGEGQMATLMLGGTYANAILLTDMEDGKYAVDLTAEMIGTDGKVDGYVRIDSGESVWQSDIMHLITSAVPNVETEIEARYPTAFDIMLSEMAAHKVEMNEAVERAEAAADRAGSGSGDGDGTSGGGIQEETDPTVPAWAKEPNKPTYTADEVGAQPKGDYALKSDIPKTADEVGALSADKLGEAVNNALENAKESGTFDGAPGADGKTAYELAVDNGFEGSEVEWLESLHGRDGVDAAADTVLYSPQTLTEEQKTQARANVGAASQEVVSKLSEEIAGKIGAFEPATMDIPKIFYGAALPQNKTETMMRFRYVSQSQDIDCYCETKAQGNSSMSYPKKNQTTKLFADFSGEEKVKVDFKGWGKQNKFCLKANWIDLSHARNIVSARLWGDVVRSRDNFEELPKLLRTSPNMGAIDGFPVKVYGGGKYQGRYTLNIPKDKWLTNMDDDNPNHCILCGEDYGSGCFRAAAKIDGTDWSDEIHDVVPESIKTRWNEVISFVMNSTNEEFVANLGSYFDVPSLIDYYLFGLAICNMDGFGKNQLYLTYDGLKWIASVYDMDATWGLYYDARHFVGADYARAQYEDFVSGREGNLLYIRLAELFNDAIVARWEVLRNDALSIDNIINCFERFTDIAPASLVAEDYAETTADGAFTAIPLKDTNNIQQLRAYAISRLEYVNAFVSAKDENNNLWKVSDKQPASYPTYVEADKTFAFDYGYYYRGVSRSGWVNWREDMGPLYTINGEDVTLTGVTNGGAGRGIALPIAFEAGATYRLAFDVEGRTIFSIMYYNADKVYQKYVAFSAESEFNGSYDTTFVAQDYPYALVQFGIHPNTGNTVGPDTITTVKNIVIEKI